MIGPNQKNATLRSTTAINCQTTPEILDREADLSRMSRTYKMGNKWGYGAKGIS
jgi:hypothetical protein